jgi:hypothetical protein
VNGREREREREIERLTQRERERERQTQRERERETERERDGAARGRSQIQNGRQKEERANNGVLYIGRKINLAHPGSFYDWREMAAISKQTVR